MNKQIVVIYPNCMWEEKSTYNLNIDDHTITIQPINTEIDNSWTEKGLKGRYSLKNTDNSVIIKLDNKKISLDYSELEKLMLLTKIYEVMQNKLNQFEIKELAYKDLEIDNE